MAARNVFFLISVISALFLPSTSVVHGAMGSNPAAAVPGAASDTENIVNADSLVIGDIADVGTVPIIMPAEALVPNTTDATHEVESPYKRDSRFHTRGVQSWASGSMTKGWESKWNMAKDSYGSQNRDVVPDPAGAKGSVLQITYPAGTRNPAGKKVGGTGFYAQPIDISKASTVTFSYKIMFPKGFNFVKGGKLPGLYGGHYGCSGGNDALDCFSTRFMFRTNGLGEIYLYVDRGLQDPGFCKVKPVTLCNPVYGASMGRGAYNFTPGQWVAMSQTITLNTFSGKKPNKDGRVTVYSNGKKVIDFGKVVFTPAPSIGFGGIDFETFFGGNDNSWCTPTTQEVYFKEFALSAF